MKKFIGILLALMLCLSVTTLTWATDMTAVAKIGTAEYPTLQAAVDAANNGDTITLLGDVELSATLVINKEITLDMAGKKLYNTSDIWDEDAGSWSLVSVRTGGKLTVTGNGTFDSKADDCYAIDLYDKGTTCTIENGTFYGNISAIYVYFGELTINGGYFGIKQQATTPDDKYRYTLNCFDSSYTSGDAKITVNGGTFSQFNPLNCLAEGSGTNFATNDYVATEDADGNWTVTEKYVAEINGAKYETLQAAINAAKDGDTIKLLNDVTISDDTKGNTQGILEISKKVTVNGNNHTIIVAQTTDAAKQASAINVLTGGEVNFLDLVLDGNKKAKHGINVFGGNVNLNNVTLKNFTGYGMVVQGTATATNLVTIGNGWGGVNVDVNSYKNNSEFVLNSGTVESVIVEHTTADTTYKSNATITGGSIDSAEMRSHGNIVTELDGATLSISGGMFGTDPTPYLANGYEASMNNRIWTVTKTEPVQPEVPVRDNHPTRRYPAVSNTTAGTDTKTGSDVTSAKTFDAGVALYVGMSVLSLTGSALVIGKKKEF